MAFRNQWRNRCFFLLTRYIFDSSICFFISIILINDTRSLPEHRCSSRGASAIRFADRESAGKRSFRDGDLGETYVRQWGENRGIDYRFPTLLWIVWERALFTLLSSLCSPRFTFSCHLSCLRQADKTRNGGRMAAIDDSLYRDRIFVYLAILYRFLSTDEITHVVIYQPFGCFVA